MGWMYTEKSRDISIKEFFEKQFGKSILECKVKNLRTAYMAVQIEPGKVIGVVCLLDYRSDHFNFGYKDMSEDMGPVQSEAPVEVLERLSPLEKLFDFDTDAYAWAKAWRDRCWAFARRKKLSLRKNMKITFPYKVKFTNGVLADTFKCINARRLTFETSNGRLVRLNRKTINKLYNEDLLEIG